MPEKQGLVVSPPSWPSSPSRPCIGQILCCLDILNPPVFHPDHFIPTRPHPLGKRTKPVTDHDNSVAFADEFVPYKIIDLGLCVRVQGRCDLVQQKNRLPSCSGRIVGEFHIPELRGGLHL